MKIMAGINTTANKVIKNNESERGEYGLASARTTGTTIVDAMMKRMRSCTAHRRSSIF